MELYQKQIVLDALSIHYLDSSAHFGLDSAESETAVPILFLHGWPTSSYLWRDVMRPIAARHRTLAIDLPGFGQSDKPLDKRYDFTFYSKIIDQFLAALNIKKLSLVVHDLGGPIGLFWAVHNSKKVVQLGLLNTLVYPEFSFAVKAFLTACRAPGIRQLLTSQWGLKRAMLLGVKNSGRLNSTSIMQYQKPFVSSNARQALLKSVTDIRPRDMVALADQLRNLTMPIRIIYGKHDRALPDIEKTIDRLTQDLPQAEVTCLRQCGHFLQEESPEEIGALLLQFFDTQINVSFNSNI